MINKINYNTRGVLSNKKKKCTLYILYLHLNQLTHLILNGWQKLILGGSYVIPSILHTSMIHILINIGINIAIGIDIIRANNDVMLSGWVNGLD